MSYYGRGLGDTAAAPSSWSEDLASVSPAWWSLDYLYRQYIAPPEPLAKPPILQPPPAPITRAAQTQYGVFDPYEAIAQRGAQFGADAARDAGRGTAADYESPAGDSSAPAGASWGWYAVGAAGLLFLVIAVRR